MTYTTELEKHNEMLQSRVIELEATLNSYKRIQFTFIYSKPKGKIKFVKLIMSHPNCMLKDIELALIKINKTDDKMTFNDDATYLIGSKIKINQPLQYYIDYILEAIHMPGIEYTITEMK